MIKILPPQKYLKECFRYDPKTGKLFWKRRPRKHFYSNKEFKRWNTCWAGVEAFTADKIDLRRKKSVAYKHGTLDGIMYFAHRIIWKFTTGLEPPAILDHKDRQGVNNRKNNLRPASYGQNFINRIDTCGVSKIIGIRYKAHRYRPWNARIQIDKKSIDLGWFALKKEAIAARKMAEKHFYGDYVP